MRARYDWSLADWSLNDRKVSQQVGAAESTVRNKRKELSLPPNSRNGRNAYHRKTAGINWSGVDWSLSERKLAEQHRLSRATIRRLKKRYSFPSGQKASNVP